MKQIIRQAKLSDVPDIARIQVETWQYAYRGMLPDDYLDSLSVEEKIESWEDGLSDPNRKQTAFVVIKDNEIAGWASIGPNRDVDMGAEYGELCGMYIHPKFHRQGLGKLLMSHSLSELKKAGYKTATLWVLTMNRSGCSFYESQGWQKEGKIKNEYKDGQDLHQTRYIKEL